MEAGYLLCKLQEDELPYFDEAQHVVTCLSRWKDLLHIEVGRISPFLFSALSSQMELML